MHTVSITARLLAPLAAVAAAVALGAGGAAAAPALPSSSFFTLSRISAVSVPAESATRFSVTLAGVHANDAPTISWYLHLVPAGRGSDDLACDDGVLAGGKRVNAHEYLWASQPSSFLWYHGAVGAYPGDRSYGCDQAAIGRSGYPGSVTVVAENEYQHCTASFAGTTTGSKPEVGAPASCAIGGYSLTASLLPVPAALTALYRSLDAQLGTIVGQVRRGGVASPGALTSSLRSVLSRQSSAYERLFPPVWGCGFAALFHAVLLAQAALGTRPGDAAGSGVASAGSVAEDAADMRGLADAVASCARSATSAGGAPAAVVKEVERLSAETSALSGGDGQPSAAAAPLAKRLAGIGDSLDALVSHTFPTVFGMPFIGLVNTTLGIGAQAALAEHDAAAGKSGATLTALEGILGPEQATARALAKQQRRVVRAENKNA